MGGGCGGSEKSGSTRTCVPWCVPEKERGGCCEQNPVTNAPRRGRGADACGPAGRLRRWWTRDGQKISKSVGNVIDPVALVETFGVDQVLSRRRRTLIHPCALSRTPPPPTLLLQFLLLFHLILTLPHLLSSAPLLQMCRRIQVRYFLMSEVPFGADGDYSDRAMLACANGFLANALGAAHALLSILLSPCAAPNTAAGWDALSNPALQGWPLLS